jgi:hypothetical protein
MRLQLTVALLLAGASAAQGQTMQQRFEAAQALLDGGKAGDAQAAFEALAASIDAKRSPAAAATVQARLAETALMLGDSARAEQLALAALPALDPPAQKFVRFDALLTAARAEEGTVQYEAAERHYRDSAAIDGIDPMARLRAEAGAARVSIFADPVRAAAEMEAVVRDAEAAGLKGDALAELHTVLARARLDAGDVSGASAASNKALSLAGGLTISATLTDLAVRGDAALIAFAKHDLDRARELTAYTGAGLLGALKPRIGADGKLERAGDLTFPEQISPPPCGGPDELRPEDEAVVQFTLNADGTVSNSTPIWSNRKGPAALAFARAVMDWTWAPQSAAAIRPFFRQGPRVLRCTSAPERRSNLGLLLPAFRGWLNGLGGLAAELDDTRPQQREPVLRKLLAEREREGADSPKLVPVLVALSGLRAVPASESQQLLARALRIAVASNAPAEAQAYLGVLGASSSAKSPKARLEALDQLAQAPAIAADLRASSYVRLIRADWLRGVGNSAAAEADLAAIDTGALPPGDPIRQAAAIRLAAIASAAKNTELAARYFLRSGLEPEQCSLLDQEPRLARTPGASSNFPNELLAFDGRTITEFDVGTDGRTRNQRTIFSYPPKLFTEAAVKLSANAVYTPTYRPAGVQTACNGYRMRINYTAARTN